MTAVHREGGTGASEASDPLPINGKGEYDPHREVSRMYMEFCAKGDMKGFLEWKHSYVYRVLTDMRIAMLMIEADSRR